MDYKLAEQLKNAGFPQKSAPFAVIPLTEEEAEAGKYQERVYLPTLSELIEACRDKFRRLERNDEYADITYFAVSNVRDDMYDEGYVLNNGKTPEEAVAKLWLALNPATEHHPTVTSV